MCGILCLICFNSNVQTSSCLEAIKKIEPRGPDHTSVYEYRGNNYHIVMGFTRLAIQDLSELGNQPFHDNMNSSLMCNGEIYNHEHLKHKYEIETVSHSDCEVLLPLIKKIGFNQTIDVIDAEFACLYHDAPNEKIMVARDRYGVRPLFIGFNYQTKTIGFASELKSLYPHLEYIQQIKTNQIVTLELKQPFESNMQVQRYYSFQKLYLENNYNNINIVRSLTRYYLIEAINKRLKSDRPIGFLLSGGLDSSLIVAIAHKLMNGQNMECFTVGSPDCDDVKVAKEITQYLGIENHHVIPFNFQEGCQMLPYVIKTIESYDVTTVRASTPQLIMANYIKDNTNIKVILSGEGSDEIHGSYRYFKDAPSNDKFHEERVRLLSDLQYYDNLRTDRTMASCGLEVRVPFLDFNYVQFIFSINSALLRHDRYTIEKKLLRDSFLDMLPPHIMQRKKEAFSDSVSSNTQSWVGTITSFVEKYQQIPLNGRTKEGQYYYDIFKSHYGNLTYVIPYPWMPKFQTETVTDPSATVLKCY